MFQVPSQREGEAREALFTAHPEMATWPAEHGFVFYYLAVENALLLNHYGGASHISVRAQEEEQPAKSSELGETPRVGLLASSAP